MLTLKRKKKGLLILYRYRLTWTLFSSIYLVKCTTIVLCTGSSLVSERSQGSDFMEKKRVEDTQHTVLCTLQLETCRSQWWRWGEEGPMSMLVGVWNLEPPQKGYLRSVSEILLWCKSSSPSNNSSRRSVSASSLPAEPSPPPCDCSSLLALLPAAPPPPAPTSSSSATSPSCSSPSRDWLRDRNGLRSETEAREQHMQSRKKNRAKPKKNKKTKWILSTSRERRQT